MSSKDYGEIKFLALGVVAGVALGAALALSLSKRAAAPPAKEGSTAEPTPVKLWKCAKNDVDSGAMKKLGQRKDTVRGECQVGLRKIVDDSVDTKVGLWSCTPGKFKVPTRGTTETCYILEGRATLTTSNADELMEIAAGDVVVLPRGWDGHWEITEKIRKLYVVK